jgi:quercetin dioxygenase-like cupin family protein
LSDASPGAHCTEVKTALKLQRHAGPAASRAVWPAPNEDIMLTRRTFAACALCAAGGFLAAAVEAQTAAATTGLKRTLLKQTDGPIEGYVTVEMRVDIEPGAEIARHTHPGVESGYVVEGGTDLAIDGIGEFALKPGDPYQVPTGVPHSAKNGVAKTVLVATYVVEKGKPLASPA